MTLEEFLHSKKKCPIEDPTLIPVIKVIVWSQLEVDSLRIFIQMFSNYIKLVTNYIIYVK